MKAKNTSFRMAFRIAIAILLTGLLTTQFLVAQPLNSTDWQYHIPITITNGGSALTEYQVKLSLDGTFPWSHAKSDGSDIRVTSSDGITEIPYWFESWTPSTSATIWVKVPLVAVGTTTVYLYYGNPSATTTASGTNTFEFFDDFSYTETISVDNETAIAKAINWIRVGQDFVNNDAGGVPFWYNYPSGPWYDSDYPEVTGYIIPTIFDRYHVTNDADLLNRAITMADWELTIEGGDGTWGFVYDNGMVMQGLLRAYEEILAADPTKAATYLASLTRAAAWLLAGQDANGSWVTGSYGGFAHSYHSRVDWVLLRLWQVTGNSIYKDMAVANLNWVLAQEVGTSGWFNNNGIGSVSENPAPLTHAIAYCAEGLLESEFLLSATDPEIATDCIEAAQRTADALLLQRQADGSLTGANYNSSWVATTSFECLTGSSQTSIVWSRLYHHTGNAVYLNAARAMNRYLTSVQGNSANPGIDGGIAGSDPITGSYNPNIILSWATKFFLDALYLEKLYGGNYTVQISAIDPAKWAFPSGGSYFSNQNGTLYYNGPSAGFGPRIRALKDGIDFIFTNGIIEYRNMGNGGFDQFGIMYRTAVPNEDANGYMHFPSTYSGDHFWYACERNGGGTVSPYPTGGSFVRSTWYDVRAVINGADHSFFANGSPTVTRPDATFSSGALGLLAWGNAVSWVDNFRVRQYAASEPGTSLGSEVFNGKKWVGAISSHWTGFYSWEPNGEPSSTDNVTITDVVNDPVISSPATCRNMIIEPSATLTIEVGGMLSVNGGLMTNGIFTINSTSASNGGSLIVTGGTVGNVTYNRYLRPDNLYGDRHLFSSPVGGQGVEAFITANPGKIYLSGTDYEIREWNEALLSANWQIVSPAGSFGSGRGYRVNQAEGSDGLLKFTGTVVNSITVTATSPYANYNGNPRNTAADYGDPASIPPPSELIWAPGRSWINYGGGGWNLMGNPFTSAMNAATFVSENSGKFDPNYQALYLYDGNRTTPRYLYAAAVLPYDPGYEEEGFFSDNIQTGQGFFVLALYNDIDFNFTPAMQVHNIGRTLLKSGKAEADPWPGLQLKVAYGDKARATTIVYNSEMTTGCDPGYDVGQLSTGPDVEVYTTLVLKDNSVNFARQALPMEGCERNIIPVGIDSEKGGEVTFSAYIVPFEDKKFWLEDRAAGIFTDLNNGTYTITLPANTYGTGRFFIIASTNTPTGIDKPQADDTDVRVWTSNDKVIIKGEVSDRAICTVYDLRGQKIVETYLNDGELNTVTLPSGLHGVYLVRVVDGVQVTTRKVAIL